MTMLDPNRCPGHGGSRCEAAGDRTAGARTGPYSAQAGGRSGRASPKGDRTESRPACRAQVPASSLEGHDMATARQLPADVYPETLSRLPPLKREALNRVQRKAYDALAAP